MMPFYILLFVAILTITGTLYARKIDEDQTHANGFVSSGAQKTLYSSTIALCIGFHNCEDPLGWRSYEDY
jgi:hypothetical protein